MDIEKNNSNNNDQSNPEFQSNEEFQELLAENYELKLENERLKLEREDKGIKSVQREEKVDRLVRGIYYLTGVLVILLFLRFLLLLFNANTENIFANLILNISYPFAIPFANLFTNPEIGNKFTIEVTTIVAIFIYSLLAWLIVSLINVFVD